MNSDTQAAQAGGSGSAHLFLQAMAEVAAATSPEEIISALQKHILSDADHIGLIQVGFGAIGEPVFRSAASRDRDGLAGEDIPPEAVRQALGSSPLFIADVGELDEAEAPLRAYIEDTLRAASLALIPLTGRARIAGYLVVASRQPRRYSEEEQQALTALAQQAAVILENTLLLDTLSRQTERLSLINELAQAIKGAFDVAALGRQVVQTLSQIIPLSHLSIALLEPDGQEAQMHTFHGSPLPSPAPVTDSCLGAALREGRSLQIESVRDCGSYGEHWAAAGAPTLLIVPLTARKRHVGTLNIGLPDTDTLSQDDIDFCKQVAAQIGVALENVRLFGQLESSLVETSSLYSISLAINAAQNLREVYETVLKETVTFSEADQAHLYLARSQPEGEPEAIEQVATWRDGHLIPGGEAAQPISEVPILAQFLQTRANLLFNDIQTDERLSEETRAYYAGQGVNALLMIPLSTGITWLGALLLEARQGQTFTDEQARFCRNVADQATLAINSHLSLERARRAVAREQMVREIVERIRNAKDVQSVLRIASEELGEVLGPTALSGEPSRALTGGASPRALTRPTGSSSLSAEDQALIEDIMDQVELAIENLNLLESTRRAALREQVLSEITFQLQRSFTVEEVLETAVRALQKALADYDITLRLVVPPEGEQPAEGNPAEREPDIR